MKNTKTSEVKEHSEFGGSQAERIMNCPGSVVLSRGMPNKESEASIEGTNAHACLEFFIKNRKKLALDKTRRKLIELAEERWDEDKISYALDALTWVLEEAKKGGPGVIYAETKLDSSKFTTDGQMSTLDIAILKRSKRELVIADYKYGSHPVEVKNNSQLIYYALGMLIKLKAWKDVDTIKLVIIQPRASHKDGHIREWSMSVEDAIRWGKKFKKVVKVALAPNAPLNYGDKWCFFCPAKSKCPIIKNKMCQKAFA